MDTLFCDTAQDARQVLPAVVTGYLGTGGCGGQLRRNRDTA